MDWWQRLSWRFYILEDENVSILKRFPVYYPDVVEIDPTTLAIHFPDMLDSQGNKIFASLSKDGRGGDIVEFEHIEYLEDDEPSYMIKGLCIFAESSLFVKDIDNRFDRVFYDEMGCNFRNKELKVIGIQE